MTEEPAVRPAPGRPKDAEKRAAILRAAREMFFKHGLGATTIEAVAAAAGVSRMTVYGHFGDKDALFAEVIRQEGLALSQTLAGFVTHADGSSTSGAKALRADLVAFGCSLVLFLSKPEVRAFNRLLEAEAQRHTTLAQAFIESGPLAVVRALAERLRQAAAAGVIQTGNPIKAARHLIALFRGIETSTVSLGLAPPPAEDAVAQHVTECVELILRAYALPQPGRLQARKPRPAATCRP